MKETYNRKNLSFKELFLAFWVIVFSILISEIIYSFNNRSPHLFYLYLTKTKIYAQRNDLSKSLSYLYKAAEINLKFSVKKYPKTSSQNFDSNIASAKLNPWVVRAFNIYLSRLKPELLIETEQGDMAKIFYDLGLLGYKNKQDDTVEVLFKMAVYLNPELSHYHVELANYYLVIGNKEKAKEAIEFCLKFTYPQKHCREFIGDNIHLRIPKEVGFLENELNEYYNNSRKAIFPNE